MRAEDERARLSSLVHWGSGPSVRRAKLPNRGVREMPNAAAGCHAAPKGNRSYCCEYSRVDAGKDGIALSACAGSEVALVGASDCKAVKLLSTQIVRKTGESTFHLQRRHTLHATLSFNAFQQYEWLTRLATAKLERRRPILGLAHPPPSETARIH
jgi:hypothetical protein